jgi:uncharacterized membrane protein
MTDVPPPPPPPSYGAPPPGSPAPDVGTALSYGWKKFQQYVGVALGVILIPLGVSIVISLIAQAARSSIFLYVVIELIGFIVNAALAIGIYNVALMITAGEEPTIGKAFTYDRWGDWILFSIVWGLMIGIGLALCIIPGLFLLAFFGLAPYYFIDGRMSLGNALTAAREAASSKSRALPTLLVILVGLAGLLACGIGVFVTAPLAYIAVAFLYRYAAGQPVAA